MPNKRYIVTILLLLLVALTVAAEDSLCHVGCRRGTILPAVTRQHRAQGQQRQAGGDFYHGNRRQLVVLAAFSDQQFQDGETAALTTWNKIFNVENYQEGSFIGSIHDYFLAQSYDDFNLTFDIQYVQLDESIVKYRSTGVTGDDENSQYLVQDIMEVLKTRDIDWSPYDWNGDGFVNQLLVIFAGKGQNNGGGNNSIWPHQWWMSEHQKDRQQGVKCDPISVTCGQKQYLVDCYCTCPEFSGSGDYGSFGTICHEYSHCFGFPDFYYGSTKYVAGWDLMDSGNYNGSGFCPAGYSAHERWLMGWLHPAELATDTTVSNMPALYDEPQAYLIRNEGYDNEYYLVENRQQKGWDSSLPGSGLLVFHVDFDESVWVSSNIMANSSKLRRYTIIPASNRTQTSYASGWPYPYQGVDSLTNNSMPAAVLNNPNSDGSMLMNKSLYNMKVGDGLASFLFTIDGTTGIATAVTKRKPQLLYRIADILIVRMPDGTMRKVMP